MQRHVFVAIIILLVAYLGIAVLSVASRGKNEQLQAQNSLTQAAQEIANNPATASRDFQIAGEQATLGLKYISILPWWSKILTLLPPFRYRVETLQADIQLASAGSQACQLRASFPNLLDPKTTSTSDALSRALNHSYDWYQSHGSQILTLQKTLAQAAHFMPAPLPELTNLNKNLASAITTMTQLRSSLSLSPVHTAISLSDEKNLPLGQVLAENQHFSAVQFQGDASTGVISIVIPEQFIQVLVAKREPLELSGVSPKIITEQSLQNGHTSSSEALSALTADILSHPEHLKNVERAAQQYPLQLTSK